MSAVIEPVPFKFVMTGRQLAFDDSSHFSARNIKYRKGHAGFRGQVKTDSRGRIKRVGVILIE